MDFDEKQQKVYDLIKSHPDFKIFDNVAINEIHNLHEKGLLDDLLSHHKKIYKDKKKVPGDTNPTNSVVSYLAGITTAKPSSEFALTKRRTYGRAGFPDIDMDFDHFRRHEIIEYLIVKYGREYVGNIGTTQTLKTKAAVRRAIKVLDPTNTVRYDEHGKEVKSESNANFALENVILKTLPEFMKLPNGDFVNSVEAACRAYPEFGKYMEAYPKVKEVASKIEGMISGAGKHAAGVVISPVPLSHICPLHVTTGSGDNATIATQFSMQDVENMGLIKFDILGLKTKTAVDIACKWIKESEGREFDWNTIPLDDEKTMSLLRSGKTDGCFQLESTGMKQALQAIGIDRFEDLVIIVAMYRPGPKDYIPELGKRKSGELPVSFPHPAYKDIAKSTYGILCFQEDTLISMADGTEKKIKEVKNGDEVCSVNLESRKIEIKICRGCAPTRFAEGLSIMLENGYSISVTDDHEILTYDGFIAAKDLQIGTLVAAPL